ncbi:MAG: right-handed parallel beta-helix repeat-containing protein, partial [Planctomycetes bacterium]|nr:right-handed parallel beta-helix repeat-containing protein [Planctomycetota bacterium]
MFYQMSKTEKITIILLILVLLTPCIFGGDVYVATNGSDTYNGSINFPYATIQKAVSELDPGETCYIRGGSYHETVDLSGLNGTESSPITFTNYQDEAVTMDGTIPITSSWSMHTGNIYKTTVPEDIWQLFVDGEPMTLARFPNVKAWSEDVWDADLSRRRFNAGLSSNGTLVDDPSLGHPDTLAGSGVSFDGAIAVMNTGNWYGDAQIVTNHFADSNTFNYDLVPDYRDAQPVYFIEGFQALDAPGEWFYKPEENTLYFWTEDGQDPTGLDIRAKNQTYALMGINGTETASHIVLDGLNFFATGFYLSETESITIQNCVFDYPSSAQRTLGKLVSPPGMHSQLAKNLVFRNNKVWRSEIEWEARSMDHPIIENNLFSEISPSAGVRDEGNSVAAFRSCFKAIICRNTFDTVGCANGFTIGHRATGDGCLIEYNLFNRTSLLQFDAMGIQFSFRPYDSVIRNNWFLNARKGSWRYDGIGGQTHANCYRNVTFGDVGTATIKGDYHEV